MYKDLVILLYVCRHEFGQMYWLVIVKGLMWYLAM
ncbi:hypothetical protein F383_32188 [Gossypium arboreum]|uniref:Uncharacterized protein n=1 Tax=Gossypium arboreum TaxID=29729 RepID=A0A0B0N1L6_GOSAR|nr:hypothetical protein F383_32188 [Gossypium arboreum]